jgi:hypothetical protein
MRTLIRKTWKFKQYSIFFTTETKDWNRGYSPN